MIEELQSYLQSWGWKFSRLTIYLNAGGNTWTMNLVAYDRRGRRNDFTAEAGDYTTCGQELAREVQLQINILNQ